MTVTTGAPVRRFPLLRVETPRLLVRPLAEGDAHAVADVFDDRQTRRWVPVAAPFTLADARRWCSEAANDQRDSGDGDHYAVIRRADGVLVGCLWTRRTDWSARVTRITYAITPDARGFGVACEAVDALAVSLLLEHGFQRVELRIAPGNLASRRVAEKAGFTYEGLLRNAGYVHGGRVDLEVWSLVAADLRLD